MVRMDRIVFCNGALLVTLLRYVNALEEKFVEFEKFKLQLSSFQSAKYLQ
jgi:hypothetical protein